MARMTYVRWQKSRLAASIRKRGIRFENKKEKPAASGRHDMVSGRIQYPAHRRHFLSGLSDSHKHPDILRDLRSLLVSGFWKTRQETYRTNYPL